MGLRDLGQLGGLPQLAGQSVRYPGDDNRLGARPDSLRERERGWEYAGRGFSLNHTLNSSVLSAAPGSASLRTIPSHSQEWAALLSPCSEPERRSLRVDVVSFGPCRS